MPPSLKWQGLLLIYYKRMSLISIIYQHRISGTAAKFMGTMNEADYLKLEPP